MSISNKEKARIILDIIDIETSFNWNDNDDVWLDAIMKGFEVIKSEEENRAFST